MEASAPALRVPAMAAPAISATKINAAALGAKLDLAGTRQAARTTGAQIPNTFAMADRWATARSDPRRMRSRKLGAIFTHLPFSIVRSAVYGRAVTEDIQPAQGSRPAAEERPIGLDALRRLLARKAAQVIRSDPEEAATALEIGLIDRRWLDDPVNHPISSSKPTEILEQFLTRSVERKPSLLSTVGLSAVQLLSSHRSPESGESRVMTVLFTDLEGFTHFTDTNGDAAAVEVVDRQQRVAGPVVRGWRGRLVKHLGDGMLCTFSDADSAVRASLELLATSPAPLRMRAGLHIGEVVVSRGDVVGHVVNVAARITETAKGGQVVMTAETAEAAGDIPGVEFKKLRAKRLKGVTERVLLREAVAVESTP